MSDAIAKPNIISDPSADSVLAAAVVMIVLSSLAVPMRFLARKHQDLAFMADDWLSLPALIINWIFGGLVIWAWSNHSLGYTTPTPPDGTDPLDFLNYKIQTGKKLIFSLEFMQSVSLTCTKTSCLFFYRRIFYTGQKNAFHWVSVGLIGVSIAWGISFGFTFLFACKTHLTALWTDIRTLNEECQVFLPAEIAFGITDMTVDIAVFILPFVMVSRLKMSTGKKVATLAMFLLGGFAIASSVMRAAVLLDAVMSVTRSYQQTKTGANNGPVAAHVVWACIESCATLTASCLPAIYVPIRNAIRRARASPDKTDAAGTAGTVAAVRQRQWPKISQLWTLSGIDRMDETNDSIPMVTAIATTASRASDHVTDLSDNHGLRKRDSREAVEEGQIRVTQTLEQVSRRV